MRIRNYIIYFIFLMSIGQIFFKNTKFLSSSATTKNKSWLKYYNQKLEKSNYFKNFYLLMISDIESKISEGQLNSTNSNDSKIEKLEKILKKAFGKRWFMRVNIEIKRLYAKNNYLTKTQNYNTLWNIIEESSFQDTISEEKRINEIFSFIVEQIFKNLFVENIDELKEIFELKKDQNLKDMFKLSSNRMLLNSLIKKKIHTQQLIDLNILHNFYFSKEENLLNQEKEYLEGYIKISTEMLKVIKETRKLIKRMNNSNSIEEKENLSRKIQKNKIGIGKEFLIQKLLTMSKENKNMKIIKFYLELSNESKVLIFKNEENGQEKLKKVKELLKTLIKSNNEVKETIVNLTKEELEKKYEEIANEYIFKLPNRKIILINNLIKENLSHKDEKFFLSAISALNEQKVQSSLNYEEDLKTQFLKKLLESYKKSEQIDYLIKIEEKRKSAEELLQSRIISIPNETFNKLKEILLRNKLKEGKGVFKDLLSNVKLKARITFNMFFSGDRISYDEDQEMLQEIKMLKIFEEDEFMKILRSFERKEFIETLANNIQSNKVANERIKFNKKKKLN